VRDYQAEELFNKEVGRNGTAAREIGRGDLLLNIPNKGSSKILNTLALVCSGPLPAKRWGVLAGYAATGQYLSSGHLTAL
jgi:hypothetical protein